MGSGKGSTELRPEERDQEIFLEERTAGTVPLDKERSEGGRGLRQGKGLGRSSAHCTGSEAPEQGLGIKPSTLLCLTKDVSLSLPLVML